MQFSRYFTCSKNSPKRQLWFWALELILIVPIFYYIIDKISKEQFSFNSLFILFRSPNFILIFFTLIILMVSNWLLESKKWQLIAKNEQSIPLLTAFKTVLTGVSFDSILPFGLGATGSRVLSLDSKKRKKIIAPIILAQSIQSFWTLAFGLVGVSQIARATTLSPLYSIEKITFILAILGFLVVIAILKKKSNLISTIVLSIKNITTICWLKITIIAFFRYIVFLTQFLLLSIYLTSGVPLWTLIGCGTWMFLGKTIIPRMGHLSAVGIRGASVIFFFSLYNYSYTDILLATFILWIINLAIPSLIGLFYIKNLSFKTYK